MVNEIEELLNNYRTWLKEKTATGCNLHTEKQQDLLRMILNGFGVKLNNEALEVHASADNLPLRKHNLIQAMLAVNDLFIWQNQ